MNGYVFYTFEGHTESPTGKECENIQLLGFEYGQDKKEAKKKLIETREWIEELDFDIEEIEAKQLLTEENKNDIKIVIEYLWSDEQKHFEEKIDKEINAEKLSSSELQELCPNHVFTVLKRLKKMIG
ncbi:MAG: hypothetical protein II921_08295 [Treponema sp.]|nr:hypothetical protein [Treponema sp.]